MMRSDKRQEEEKSLAFSISLSLPFLFWLFDMCSGGGRGEGRGTHLSRLLTFDAAIDYGLSDEWYRLQSRAGPLISGGDRF